MAGAAASMCWGPPKAARGPRLRRFEGVEARRLGIDKMAAKAVQGRGVLVDLRRHLGDERTLVGYDG
jgi:hypothetical protein